MLITSALMNFIFVQGRVLGITVGCLLGMIPLIFLKEKEEGSEIDAKAENVENKSDTKPKNDENEK